MSSDDFQSEPSESEKLFVRIVLAKYLATNEHVDSCLKIQAEETSAGSAPRSLGEIMVQQGFITGPQLEMVQEEQTRRSRPRRFGPYELLAKLGEGGMGMVYRARHIEKGEVVALKVVSKRAARDENVRQRFSREANVGMKLDHPNIVATRDAGEVKGIPYLALELIEGGSLRDRLKKKNLFTELEALHMVQDIALALEHAHQKGLVHRDIKPENILFDSSFAVKLSDFGLVKYAEPGLSNLTHTGTTVGTPHYISPEQARAEADIDIRADIYSLGATLYRLVTGETPFQGSSPLVVMTKHLNEQLKPPDELNPQLSEGCVALVEKMMAKERSDRYDSPTSLIRDIDRVIAGKLPESAPLAATKSSVARSVVREEKTKSTRRSSRRVPAASRSRGRKRTTGFQQTLKQHQQSTGSSDPTRPGPKVTHSVIAVSVLIALVAGGWVVVNRKGDSASGSNPGQGNRPDPTQHVKGSQPIPQKVTPPKAVPIVQGQPAAERLAIPAGAIHWVGRGGDGKWSTAANWKGNVVPKKLNIVAFAGTARRDCVIDEDVSVAGIFLDNDFTRKLEVGPGRSLYVGEEGVHVSGGTFYGGAGKMALSGGLVVKGGTFVSTSGMLKVNKILNLVGGSFHHHSGTLAIWKGKTSVTQGKAKLNDVVINTPGPLTVSGAMRIDRHLSIRRMNANVGGPIEVKGNVVTSDQDTLYPKSLIRLNGDGDQIIAGYGRGGHLPPLTIAKPKGKVFLQGTLRVKGNWIVEGGEIEAGSSRVVFVGGNARIDAPKMIFNEVVLNTSGIVTVLGKMSVRGDFRVKNVNQLNGGTILVGGHLEKTGAESKYRAEFLRKKWPVSKREDVTALKRLTVPAGVVKWTGRTGDGKWSTADNWEGRRVPDVDAVVYFGGSSKSCAVAEDVSVSGLFIDHDFAGTMALTRGKKLKVGSLGFHMLGGRFVGGDKVVEVVGAFALYGGTFVSTTDRLTIRKDFKIIGGRFEHNGGLVHFERQARWNDAIKKLDTTPNITVRKALELNHLHLDGKGGSGSEKVVYCLDPKSVLKVARTLEIGTTDESLENLEVNGGEIRLQGGAVAGQRASGGTTKVIFEGSDTQQIRSKGGRLPHVVIDKKSGQVESAVETSSLAVADFTLKRGTFRAPKGRLDVEGHFTVTGGAFLHNKGTLFFNPLLSWMSKSKRVLTFNTRLTLGNLRFAGRGSSSVEQIEFQIPNPTQVVKVTGDLILEPTDKSLERIVVTGGSFEVWGKVKQNPLAKAKADFLKLVRKGSK